jgi:hypothetical protein
MYISYPFMYKTDILLHIYVVPMTFITYFTQAFALYLVMLLCCASLAARKCNWPVFECDSLSVADCLFLPVNVISKSN